MNGVSGLRSEGAGFVVGRLDGCLVRSWAGALGVGICWEA